jgi:hypothetical protein
VVGLRVAGCRLPVAVGGWFQGLFTAFGFGVRVPLGIAVRYLASRRSRRRVAVGVVVRFQATVTVKGASGGACAASGLTPGRCPGHCRRASLLGSGSVLPVVSAPGGNHDVQAGSSRIAPAVGDKRSTGPRLAVVILQATPTRREEPMPRSLTNQAPVGAGSGLMPAAGGCGVHGTCPTRPVGDSATCNPYLHALYQAVSMQ